MKAGSGRSELRSTFFLLLALVQSTLAFYPSSRLPESRLRPSCSASHYRQSSALEALSKKRKEELGVGDNEDEYDLGVALENNTDPLITKVIAGSLIVVIIALLVVGVVVPSLTDYGEGVCSPIQNAGRC